MTPTTTYALFFSPTGTSRKIAQAIARGFGLASPTVIVDLTHAAATTTPLPADCVAIIAAPVYGGKIAPTALARMENLRAEQSPAVVVAVYGNRDIGGAAAELAAFVAQRGFIPIAAAAFVGEHSYSTDTTPIAAGRPDLRDLAEASEFGAAVLEKLQRGDTTPIDARRLKAPRTSLWSQLRFIRFVLGYRKQQQKQPTLLLPATDASLCTHCGRCAAVCPTEAIARGCEEHTDPARCIRCNACVKSCPVGARSFATPFAAVLARNFARRKESKTLL